MTNNYLKILLHLKQFEGDGKFHEIESLLDDLPIKEKREIFSELARENLIYLDGGRIVGGPTIYISDGNTIRGLGGSDKEEYLPFSGKLQFKGSKYLKEELAMTDKDKGKYNINVEGNSTANVIIGSPGAIINNKSEIIDKAKRIIKTIENDNSIDASTRQKAIGDFNQLIEEIESDKQSPETLSNILSLGGNISSIGSLVISLIQLLGAH